MGEDEPHTVHTARRAALVQWEGRGPTRGAATTGFERAAVQRLVRAVSLLARPVLAQGHWLAICADARGARVCRYVVAPASEWHALAIESEEGCGLLSECVPRRPARGAFFLSLSRSIVIVEHKGCSFESLRVFLSFPSSCTCSIDRPTPYIGSRRCTWRVLALNLSPLAMPEDYVHVTSWPLNPSIHLPPTRRMDAVADAGSPLTEAPILVSARHTVGVGGPLRIKQKTSVRRSLLRRRRKF